MYKHILLPSDGSRLSRKAVKQGVALAKPIRAKVTGFYANPGNLAETRQEFYVFSTFSARLGCTARAQLVDVSRARLTVEVTGPPRVQYVAHPLSERLRAIVS